MQYLLHHTLRDSAEKIPDRPAILAGSTKFTYEDFASRVSAFATYLQSLGVQTGDRVAIYLKPGADLPLAIFAVSMAGGVFVPIHHGCFPDQIAHILTDCGALGLITDCDRIERLEPVLSRVPSLAFAIAENGKGNAHSQHKVQEWPNLSDPRCSPSSDIRTEKELGAILYTSGSTGRPKGVMLSHANLLAGAEIVAQYLAIDGSDRILGALPLSFDAGLNQLTTAILKGAAFLPFEFRFGRDIAKRLVAERVTGLAGVPSLWCLLAQPSSGLGKEPLPDLRYITNTGGAMPPDVLAKLRQLLPETEIFLMYGLTEAFRSTYLPPCELDRRPTSIGKAIPNTEILLINESGELCRPGEIGELVHHGPTVSMGYWNHPDLTKKILRPHPIEKPGQASRDLVCYSGDLVKMDDAGYLYFVGRRDEQIKSAGFRISSTEIEDVLYDIAPLRQAAVVGVPDPTLGQAIIAFGVLKEGAKQPQSGEVLAACAARLPRHMVPKDFIILESLPLTASGKVDYPALKRSLHRDDANQPVTQEAI